MFPTVIHWHNRKRTSNEIGCWYSTWKQKCIRQEKGRWEWRERTVRRGKFPRGESGQSASVDDPDFRGRLPVQKKQIRCNHNYTKVFFVSFLHEAFHTCSLWVHCDSTLIGPGVWQFLIITIFHCPSRKLSDKSIFLVVSLMECGDLVADLIQSWPQIVHV